MFKTDWSGNKLAYVCGTEEACKQFTIDLAWYHSAMGIIAGFNTMNSGKIVLNMHVYPEHYNDEVVFEQRLRQMAAKHGCFCFTDWDEYRKQEASA